MRKVLFALSLSVLLFACSGAPERGNYIPKSAKAVLTVNMKAIVDEIKWDILFGGDLFKLKNAKGVMKQLLEDPGKTGVEFMERSYVFIDSTGAEPAVVAMVPLSDADAFAEFLRSRGDTVLTEGDYQAVRLGKDQLLWNDETAFFVSGQKDVAQSATYVNALIDGQKGTLLATEFKGKALLTSEDHIALWASGDVVNLLMPAQGFTVYPPLSAVVKPVPASAPDADKSEYTATINFKNGKLAIAADQHLDEKSEMLKVYKNDSKLKDLSMAADVDKAMLTVAFTANMKAIAAFLGSSGFKDMLDMYIAPSGLNTEDVATMFDGDVFVSFDGVQIRMEEREIPDMNEESGEYEIVTEMAPTYYPSMVVGLSLADTIMAKQFVNRKLYNFAAINKQGVYSFGPGKGHLFFKGKYMYYVSDSAAMANVVNGKSVAANTILNDLSSGLFIHTKDVTKKLPLSEWSVSAENTAKKVEASIEGLKVMVQPLKGSTVHGELELNAVNKNENILITLLKLMKDLESAPEA
ncbi:MAG: DUF4836 family protein [Flavobacteriales bacterium]